MSIDEGKLRAYLDQALPPEELEKVREEIADSLEAQASLVRLVQERDVSAQYLAALAPPPEHRPAASLAWRRLNAQIRGQSTLLAKSRERIMRMFVKPFIRRHQSAIAILAVALITVGLFSFAPVRTMAGNLLKVFRVQTVQIVPVDKEHLRAMRDDPRFQGLIQELEPQVDVIADSEPQQVDSLPVAAKAAGFRVAEITALPVGIGAPSSIVVYQQKVVHLNLDRDLLEAIFQAAEIEITLPDSLNEEPLVVTEPSSVVQEWKQDDREILGFVQMTAPLVEYPDDLDLDTLGVAGLQLLGMSEEEATALGATIDWSTTLLLPVPKDAGMTVTEISVNGADGFIFANPDSPDDGSVVMWQRGDLSYIITGQFSADQMIEIANSVK